MSEQGQDSIILDRQLYELNQEIRIQEAQRREAESFAQLRWMEAHYKRMQEEHLPQKSKKQQQPRARPVLDASHKLLLSVEEAAACLDLGRTHMYALVTSGQVHSVKVGKRRLIPVRALERYVAELEENACPDVVTAKAPLRGVKMAAGRRA